MELLFAGNPIFTDTFVSLSPVNYCDHLFGIHCPSSVLAGLLYFLQKCLFLNRVSHVYLLLTR